MIYDGSPLGVRGIPDSAAFGHGERRWNRPSGGRPIALSTLTDADEPPRTSSEPRDECSMNTPDSTPGNAAIG